MSHRRRRSRHGAHVASLLLWLVTGTAATAVDSDTEPTFYETATVRARAISSATASVTIVDRETIEALGAQSAADLVRFVAGVDVAATGPRGGFATAQIRGGDPNHTQVLIDGVPLNDITDQVGGAVNLNGLSAALVERIEVVRGPHSSFFGSTGLAGTINIITRRGAGESPRVSFNVEAGDDAALLGSVGVGQGSERRDYFVGAHWEQQEDVVDAFDAEDSFEQFGVQGNARVGLGGAELRLSWRATATESEDYPEASGGPRLGDGALRDSEQDEIGAGVELRFGSAERRHSLQATAYRHGLDRRSPAIGFAVPASVEDTTFTAWQLGWRPPEIELRRSRLNLGLDARLEDGESDSAFPDLLDQSYAIDRTSGGVFAEYEAERGRFLFDLGARVDALEGFEGELSPRAGLSWLAPNDRTRLRASAGRAFKLPSFFALSVPVFGNPDLDPETVLSADAGVRHTFAGADLSVTLDLFFNRFEDLIDFDDLAFTFVNVPEVEARGVEAGVDWQVCERVFIHANATHQDFDSASADPLPHRPEWVGAARAQWRVTPLVRWGLDGQWVSAAYDFQIPPPVEGTAETPGYQLYGSTLTVDLAPGWDVHARVDNLADKEYEPFIGFPGPDRSFRIGLRRSP
jgi:outer membrane cobalamin receptor